MRHDWPNTKRVMLTQDGYVSASDEERSGKSSSESKDNVKMSMDGYELAANCKILMMQRVPENRIKGQGQRWNIYFRPNAQSRTPLAGLLLMVAATPILLARVWWILSHCLHGSTRSHIVLSGCIIQES
jgi:hypothetical protein